MMGMKDEGGGMRKQITDKLSIYIPATKIDRKPVERLIALGEKRDRSVNYPVSYTHLRAHET